MFEKGEWIMYGNTGVCQVEDVGMPKEIPARDKSKPYYKLNPAYESGEIYIPVDTGVFMRPILTKEQAEQLLAKLPDFCRPENLRDNYPELEEEYKACLSGHECWQWMKLLVILRFQEWQQAQEGKRIGKINQKYEKRAKELLYGELSIALELPYEKIDAYMEKKFTELFVKTA